MLTWIFTKLFLGRTCWLPASWDEKVPLAVGLWWASPKYTLKFVNLQRGKQHCPFNNKLFYNLLLKPPAIQNQGWINRSLQHEVGSGVDLLSHYGVWVSTTKSPLPLMNSHMMLKFQNTEAWAIFFTRWIGSFNNSQIPNTYETSPWWERSDYK